MPGNGFQLSPFQLGCAALYPNLALVVILGRYARENKMADEDKSEKTGKVSFLTILGYAVAAAVIATVFRFISQN